MTAPAHSLKLQKTIFHRGRFIRTVQLRAPTQADVDEACLLSETLAGRGIALLSILTNLDPLVVEKMGDDDLEHLQRLYSETPLA